MDLTQPTPDDRAAYLALCLIPGIGFARLATLLEACETPLGALRAPLDFLRALPGISPAAAHAIRRTTCEDGQQVLDAVERWGGEVLLPGRSGFPESLTSIPNPPTLLFALGDLGLLRLPAVAMVGARDHTAYGAEVARRAATMAARAGLVVVSGMARGIDAIVHTSVLDAGGATIGVLGNGFGVVYPAANRHLYDRMAAEGLLLTEHPPGERPHAGTFPRRNRLISGLSKVTLVVEAAVGSGALITADTALDQGREVMAVPGPITHRTSAGANRLLRDGATPFLETDDLLAFYSGPGEATSPAQARLPLGGALDHLNSDDRRIVEALGDTPSMPDQVAEAIGVPIDHLLTRLGLLELEGFVAQVPGARYVRTLA